MLSTLLGKKSESKWRLQPSLTAYLKSSITPRITEMRRCVGISRDSKLFWRKEGFRALESSSSSAQKGAHLKLMTSIAVHAGQWPTSQISGHRNRSSNSSRSHMVAPFCICPNITVNSTRLSSVGGLPSVCIGTHQCPVRRLISGETCWQHLRLCRWSRLEGVCDSKSILSRVTTVGKFAY